MFQRAPVIRCFATWALAASLPVHALDISGASTIQPLINQIAPIHTKESSEPVNVSAGGSGTGIKDALSGKSQIGMVSRALSDAEKAELKNTVIAHDALAIIVNQSNPLEAITKAQLVDLYSGKTAKWSALGGPDRRVQLISKEVGRSTLELFEHYTGLLSPDRKKTDKPPIAKAHVIGSNLEAATLVGSFSTAIGYVSVGTAISLQRAGMPIKILKLDNVEPSEATIKNGRYPILRPLNLVYKAETPAIKAFLGTMDSPAAQDIIKAQGFLPAK